MIAGMTAAEDLVDRVRSEPDAELCVAISSPGGCGKTAVLSAVAETYRSAGVSVSNAAALADDRTPEGAVMVDDAHLAPAPVLDRLQQLVATPGSKVFVAFRPWPSRPAIGRLTDAIRDRGDVVQLVHLSRHEVGRRTAATFSAAPTDTLVDLLVRTTGGLPMLIDEVLASLPPDVLEADGDATVLSEMPERMRRIVDRLDPGARALLHAIAVGSDLDPVTVSRVLGIDEGAVHELVESSRATGFLLPDGRAVPLVADALVRYTPPERTRAAQYALMLIRHEQRADAVPLARALASSGVRDRFVADLLVSAADQRLDRDPATAFELYADAVNAGAPPNDLALRRAESAARVGMFDVALRLVDPVLADTEAPDFLASMELAATVMAHRGLIRRAGELYAWLGHDRITTGRPIAALAFMASGAREAATELVATPGGAPTMANGVRTLMAQGAWESIEGSASTALSTFMRATTLLESADRSLLLPDTPVALTALVAIHTGELDVAEAALRRAIERDVGGQTAWTRHRVLLAWVAMLRGRFVQSRQLIVDAVADVDESDWSPRDELFIRGLQLGIARRTSDAPGLVAAWKTGRDALLRHPIDLFVLLPIGEFTIAAARLRESARVSTQVSEMWRLLQDLDEPVVWSSLPHWCGVQAAILNNRPADVEPHATALVRGATESAFASALAVAGRSWMNVLVGDVDPASVQMAARRLQDVGLAWDGSRLLGQAAGHSTDRRAMTTLLHMARTLRGSDESALRNGASGLDGSATTLSTRELEVAGLLLQGRTYREIGQQLYIAPRTVEHHVARMKQRIGASGRSDLLTRLRVLVELHN